MSHEHRHERTGSRRALLIALGLTVAFIGAEVVGGLLANSLALIADAGHMVSDAAALGLSLFALTMAARRHSDQRTFGLHRAEILAAAVNGLTLLAIAAYVVWEAVHRIQEPPEVLSGPMLAVAVLGLVVNLVALWLLGAHRGDNLNVRGAWLHVAGDALGSIAVITAALVIWFTGWTLVDPIASIVITALIAVAGWRLLREASSILLESSPPHIDVAGVRRELEAVPGVESIHDLHVWTVTSGFVSLSAHARLQAGADSESVIRESARRLHDRYEIRHVTIQPEAAQCEPTDLCCMDEHEPLTAGVGPAHRP